MTTHRLPYYWRRLAERADYWADHASTDDEDDWRFVVEQTSHYEVSLANIRSQRDQMLVSAGLAMGDGLQSGALAASWLGQAELWYLRMGTGSLVEAASKTIPEHQLTLDRVPSESGVCFMEWPISPFVGGKGFGVEIEVSAISWTLQSNGDSPLLATFLWSSFREPKKPRRWVPTDVSTWWVNATADYDDGEFRCIPELNNWVAALWAMVDSPGIFDATPSAAGRQERRQRARQGLTSPDIKILRPRSLGSTGSEPLAMNGQRYSHRWIVSGHWRLQPYGPGNSQRRPVWINPYIKGPDGAPLHVPETVRVM